MYCKNCGQELVSGVEFCKYCGVAIKTSLMQPKTDTEKINKPEEKDFSRIDNTISKTPEISVKGFLISKGENVISVLGQGYLKSYISAEGFGKNVMILSNKRLYIKGKIYTKEEKGFDSYTADLVVPLNSVTGVEIVQKSAISSNILSIIGIVGLFISGVILVEGDSDLLVGALIIGPFSLGLTIANTIKSIRRGWKILYVHFIGGPAGVLTRWYSNKELQKFRKNILHQLEIIQKK